MGGSFTQGGFRRALRLRAGRHAIRPASVTWTHDCVTPLAGVMELKGFQFRCRICWNHFSVTAFEHRLIISRGADMSEGDLVSFALGIATGRLQLWCCCCFLWLCCSWRDGVLFLRAML